MPFQDPNDKTGFLGGSMGCNPGQHTFMDLGVQLGGREMYQPSSRGLLDSISQPRVDYHQQFDGRQAVDYGQQGGYGGFSPLNTSQGLLNNMQQQQSRNSQAAIIAFLQGSGNAHITPEAQSIGSNEQCIFPSSLMTTLNLLQKNIATLQALIPLLNQTGTSTQQQEAATVGVANVLQASMAQLASAAAGLLPQAQQASRDRVNLRGMADDTHLTNPHADGCSFGLSQETSGRGGSLNTVGEMVQQMSDKEEDDQAGMHLAREDDNEDSEENLPEGSYDVMELDAMEILAEHTHFCEICNKGFKRDANLRMHMRGHGDQYKTAAALAKPDKPQEPANLRPKRFSCPYVGCKRNRKHPKFQPLKTMLCVKNHYRRSHCPKVLSCSKCGAKKFSVVADLKTHEKHCGREKWMCSCKTTFSRKDKLLGHLNLFKGHT